MNSIISDVKHIETIHSIVIRGISIHSDSTWSLIDSIKLDITEVSVYQSVLTIIDRLLSLWFWIIIFQVVVSMYNKSSIMCFY